MGFARPRRIVQVSETELGILYYKHGPDSGYADETDPGIFFSRIDAGNLDGDKSSRHPLPPLLCPLVPPVAAVSYLPPQHLSALLWSLLICDFDASLMQISPGRTIPRPQSFQIPGSGTSSAITSRGR